jgi:hypothetical protein
VTRLPLLALLLAVPALTGCISLEQGDVFPDDHDQVCVSYFTNETFYRDVEFQLTEQVVDEILSTPGLKLSSKEDAEVLLTGRVVDVHQHVLAEDKSQTPVSSSTTVTVEISLVDARSGTLLKKQRLSGRGQSVPALGQDTEFARREAFRYLARDIVRELQEDF